MMNLFTSAFNYVISDLYFWPAMAATTIVGIYIGALLYNGDIREVKKGTISILAYMTLLIITITTRIYPHLTEVSPEHSYMPFAGIMTVIIVSLFYTLGMSIGVRITKNVHKGGEK